MSLFLEGLESAREIIVNKGLAHLDSIINELKTAPIENAARHPVLEKR